jgi:hypothetical protein
MKYTEDYPHRPILGKAGEFVDILSRVPADTDIVLDVATYFSRDIAPSALEISIGNYRPFEHIIHLKDDGTLENTLKVNIRAEWNRDENMAEGEIFAALFMRLGRSYTNADNMIHVSCLRKSVSPKPLQITHVRSSICLANFRRNTKVRKKIIKKMERLTKVMDKYLTDAKLRWAQKELLQKLHDAAERHKRVVILKGRMFV